ncbi:hypothetical protein [Burkholderia plantarii]|uniref:Uncharacterized protein n=1 Tax=Burkholderia plantarii TaxID=41899 RepID=A0A0B6S1W4_BURPL|nr:hypothetical protein [Burkholderia plantarii]AJK46231.1 hypothetical protein BGL_1c17220 [Burkholderia plantarii]
MTMRIKQDYFKRETAEVAKFIDNLKEGATKGGVFDSAAANDFMSGALNQNATAVPGKLQAVLDDCADDGQRELVTKAILDGVRVYEEQHGTSVPADVSEQALHLAYATTEAARRKYGSILDSASSVHHDPLSLQPNRAVVSILTAFAEAVPWAHYLPADIGSNEAKLAIVSHNAGSSFGAYAQNDLLDGTHSGDSYVSSARIHTTTPGADGTVSGKLSVGQTTSDTCDQKADGVPLLRGRTLVYVNGILAAKEPIDSAGSGNSPVNGSITLAGTTFVIGGTVNTDTGVYALTTTPKMPDSIPVSVEGFIDFERSPNLTPTIITSVNMFSLYANPWRVLTRQSIDGRTQMANELNLDPYSESVIAIQNQFANERHYNVLAKARRLAGNNQSDYNFDWKNRSAQLKRNDIWHDFGPALAKASQQMAVDTMNHGITHLYVGKDIASQWLTLANDIFEPSGIAVRPGIFRVGRLFGQYEVYYSPKQVKESPQGGEILCVGRATDVARNPVVLGDAVPPTVKPLLAGDDLREGAGFYARNFTSTNPHEPSARGCAIINVTDMR